MAVKKLSGGKIKQNTVEMGKFAPDKSDTAKMVKKMVSNQQKQEAKDAKNAGGKGKAKLPKGTSKALKSIETGDVTTKGRYGGKI